MTCLQLDISTGIILQYGYSTPQYHEKVYFPISYTTLCRATITTVNQNYTYYSINELQNSYIIVEVRGTLNYEAIVLPVMWHVIGY